MLKRLEQLRFDNSFVNALPGDPEADNFPRQVFSACYSRVLPTAVSNPQLLACVSEVAELLDLSALSCESERFTEIFSGNRLLPGMDAYASCYGGHQFGHWAGQLGDGRAINLGEVINAKGERWSLQLKGAGPTPYSRNADGLAVLRSSLREFLCSEAMFHLGVPTTRALSLITSGEQVNRDILYNGNAAPEPGAVLCRVAPSFIRFGNFQLLASRAELGLLKELLDYTIRSDFPHLGEPSIPVYLAWFEEVCRSTAELMVHWMRVGFVHGVMNTDNMSVLGLTIDYGPYGWLEGYDPGWTPNITDAEMKRYRYGNQPQIASWNLARLADALLPLIESVEPLQQAISSYASTYEKGWRVMMRNKLGLTGEVQDDETLIRELLSILPLVETDMTIFFRQLGTVSTDSNPDQLSNDQLIAPLLDAYYDLGALDADYRNRFAAWMRSYMRRIQAQPLSDAQRRQQMDAVNPKYVLRNYLAQLAIDQAEAGDNSMIYELLELLRHPYDEQPESEHFAAKRPQWARNRAGCSMLSCSS
ncbi:YdiU family protein [Mariprofundus sp. KV]|nr:YdiU family protein [Mariprofundus sp. KV]